MLNVTSPSPLLEELNSGNISNLDLDEDSKKNTSMFALYDSTSRPTLENAENITTKENLSFEDNIKITTYEFKIILIGSIAVGKTAIISRYMTNQFTPEHTCTIKVEYKTKIIKINNMEQAKLKIWDTCGEEKFRAITRQYYQDADGIILVYDIANKSSYNNILIWINEIRNSAPENYSLLLVGNKSDLSKERVISEQEGKKLALDLGINFVEVSAKNGNNIILLFEMISEQMIEMAKFKPEVKEKNKPKKLNKDVSNKKTKNEEKTNRCC